MLLKQSEMVLEHLTTVTVTFDHVTPKSFVFICYPGWMCGPSLKKVGQERPPDMCKAICPLFFKRGQKNMETTDVRRKPAEPRML